MVLQILLVSEYVPTLFTVKIEARIIKQQYVLRKYVSSRFLALGISSHIILCSLFLCFLHRNVLREFLSILFQVIFKLSAFNGKVSEIQLFFYVSKYQTSYYLINQEITWDNTRLAYIPIISDTPMPILQGQSCP